MSLNMRTVFVVVSFICALSFVSCGGKSGGDEGGGGGSEGSISPAGTYPVVTVTVPSDGSKNIAVTSVVTATFDRNIDNATIQNDGSTNDTFYLKEESGNKVIGCTVDYTPESRTAKLTPPSALAYDTKYIAVVTTAVKGVDGKNIQNQIEWSFTTCEEPDTTAPQVDVSSVFPASNAINVPNNTVVRATFIENKDIDISTVSQTTFEVKDDSNTVINGTYTYNSGNKTVTFTPATIIRDNRQYTVTLTSGIKDTSGNALQNTYSWSFTAAVEPPSVASTVPAADADNVAINSVIRVTFSESMDPNSFDNSSILVNGGLVAGSVSYDADSKTATFTPSDLLEESATFQVTVSQNVLDAQGYGMEAEYQWSFSTVLDTTAPTISSVSPAHGSASLATTGPITVTFSEDMNVSSINDGTFYLKDEFNNTINGSYNYDPGTKQASFQPSSPLIGTTRYTAMVTTGVEDAHGVNLIDNYSWSFSTAPSSVSWVVMVYMAGDNSLSDQVSPDLEEMRQSSLNGRKVRVIALADRSGPNNTHLYEIINGVFKRLSSAELGLSATLPGEVDTGSQQTLSAFIDFVKTNYPAENYSLILWNHGGGWRAPGQKFISPNFNFLDVKKRGSSIKDIAWDDTSGTYLGNNMIQGAVAGKGLTMMCMDACSMGMLETAYELRKSVTGMDYLVFSQHAEPDTGYQYTDLLNHYIGASNISAANFATIAVNDYVDYYGSGSDVTQSAVNLGSIEPVVTALNTFVTYLEDSTMSALDQARAACQYYSYPWHVDLYGFADNFADASATALKNAISAAVIANRHGNGKPGSHGLSVNFTTKVHHTDYDDANNVNSIDFLAASTWDNFLNDNTFGLTIDSHEPADDDLGGFVVNKGYTGTAYTIDPYDADVYSITVVSGGSITVSLTSVPANCDLDIFLYREDNLNQPVAMSYGGHEGQNEYISFSGAVAGKKYYLAVVPYNQNTYALNLTDSYNISFGGTAGYSSAAGILDPSFNPSASTNGGVSSLAIQSDGKILLGGSFTACNGVPRYYIARLNSDGSLDTSFSPVSGANDGIASIAIQEDGKIIIAGYFLTYDGVVCNRIARLNQNGTLDNTFSQQGSGASDGIHAIALQSDGKILIGGYFNQYNGVTRRCIARLNSDGSLDTSFDPGYGTSAIHAIVLQDNGKILLGGNFVDYNRVRRNYIARVHPDGSLDTTFDPGTGGDRMVFSIVIQRDGKIIIGGGFSKYNGISRSGIARLNADGSLDNTFISGLGTVLSVKSVALHANNKMVLVGDFKTGYGALRNYIARLHSDGSLDVSFNASLDLSAYCVAIQGNGNILIGGFFSSCNGFARKNIARLLGD